MRDWIVGYRKAANRVGPGVTPEGWERIEAEAGEGIPDELADLYSEMNGAELSSAVRLWPFRLEEGEGPFVARRAAGVWTFGEKEGQQLFVGRKPDVASAVAGRMLPDWFENAADEGWFYGAAAEVEGPVRVYRTLEQMLATMIPPTQTEEFGDTTYARALTVVQGALDTLREEAPEDEDATPAMAKVLALTPRPAASKAKAKKPAAKAKKPAAKAKKPVAKAKVAKKPAKKAKPAARKAVKKPAAKAKGKAKAKPAARTKAKPAPRKSVVKKAARGRRR